MNDFERQISAALHAAADSERPAGNLTERIMRRHRRHRLRQAAGGVAVIALVVAVPLSVPALRPGGHGLLPAVAAGARPGTVLQRCQDQFVDGSYGPGWKAGSLRAGPLWFVQARPVWVTGSGPAPSGLLPVVIRDGGYAAVTAAGSSRGTFRFLYGPGTTRGSYTLRDGSPGVTFVACSPGHDESGYRGYTVFAGLFIVARFPACVALDVWTLHARQPIRVTLPIDRSCRN
jgi:hypothetical protein